jgi:hypothetical protein
VQWVKEPNVVCYSLMCLLKFPYKFNMPNYSDALFIIVKPKYFVQYLCYFFSEKFIDGSSIFFQGFLHLL